jgi:hypothetical protein
MSKRVFVSYSHRQGQWVWERLVPILRAAGCAEVLIDRERFRAGRGVKGQMDATQDQADVSLLVLTPDYLASDYCRHEMDRALAADPDSQHDKVLPVKRADCDLAAIQHARDTMHWADLTNDTDPAEWALLLKSLDATRLNTAAPHWLDVRDEIVRKLSDQKQSVNLVVHGLPNWHALRDHLKEEWLPRLAIVNLDEPATATLPGLVGAILHACGCAVDVPHGNGSVAALDALKSAPGQLLLAFTHFDNIRARKKTYGADIFFALRYLITDHRKLVLLVESRAPAKELLPKDHPLSGLDFQLVELREK